MLEAVEQRFMPPWQPEPGHGEFRDVRRLTDEQIALFKQWVTDGTPEGDSSKTPPVPKFPEGWQIGIPDLIVKMDRPFDVPASGPDIYQNFVIPLNLKEDKWVTAVEFRSVVQQRLCTMCSISLMTVAVHESRILRKVSQAFPAWDFAPRALWEDGP